MTFRPNRKNRRSWIVLLLLLAVVSFFVISPGEGFDGGFDIKGLPGYDFVESLFDDYAAGYPSAVKLDVENPGVAVHFIDVGQAKAILVMTKEKNVLIDGGDTDQGPALIRYLVSQGVSTIDVVIGTHPHADHIGGLPEVISGITVNTVILPVIPQQYSPTTATYSALLNTIEKAGLNITPAVPGDSYDLGGGAVLTILGPVADDYDDLNDMSVVSRLRYGEISFLFTGDMTSRAENDLLNAGADVAASVLDVGHHGSNTSSSEKLVLAARPAVSVISCGIDNTYGHPHRDVVERLRKYGKNLYRTDIDGTVIVLTDGEGISVKTEKGGE